MKSTKLTLLFGAISLVLLVIIVFRLTQVSEGMNISGLVLGGFILLGILVVCLIFSWLLKLFFKQTPFWTLLLILTSVSFIGFLVRLYAGN